MGLLDKIGSKLGSKDTDQTTTDPVNEYPHTSDVGHKKSSDYNSLNSGMSNLSTGNGSSGLGNSGVGSPTTSSSGLGSSGLGSSGLGSSGSGTRQQHQMPGTFNRDSTLYGPGGNGSNTTGTGSQEFDPYSTRGQNVAHEGTASAIPIAGGKELGTSSSESGHHLGRDGALAGGAYETGKHGHGHHDQSGLGSYDGENEKKKHGLFGKSHDDKDKNHLGRDAGVAGTAAYEAEKHRGSHDNGKYGHHNGRSSIDNNNVRDERHHNGRDAGLSGGVGAAGYEAEKLRHGSQSGQHSGNHNLRHSSNDISRDDDKHHYGRDAGIAGGVGAAGYEAEKHHNKQGNRDHSSSGYRDNEHDNKKHGLFGHNKNKDDDYNNSYNNNNTRGDQHQYGRDAGVSTAAAEAMKHHDHNQQSSGYDGTSGQSSQNLSPSQHGHHNQHSSLGSDLSGQSHNGQRRGVSPGMSIAKKLSAAYEAGYRDAMAHAEAEGHKSHHY